MRRLEKLVTLALCKQVLKGKPDEVFPKVWKDWGITKLCFEKDFEPYAIERDSKIEQLAKESGPSWALLATLVLHHSPPHCRSKSQVYRTSR